MPIIHLIEGPVGAGKSTFAKQKSELYNSAILDLDEWMVVLFSPDRPQEDFMAWYESCKTRCIEQIWRVAVSILDSGSDVVLELGLVQQQAREDFYERVDNSPYGLKVYLLDVPKDERRRRVQQRNLQKSPTYKMTVSDEIFEMADKAWQGPSASELKFREIEVVGS